MPPSKPDRVCILRDTDSPLFYLRCEAPCGHPDGNPWCQFWPAKPGSVPGICYLGGSATEAGCRIMAGWAGYTVISPKS